MLRHLVLLRFREEAGADERDAVAAALRALPALIPQIRRYELGHDAGIADGNFDFSLIAEFDDATAFEDYQRHPAHQRVVREVLRPAVAARAALQVEIEEGSASE